MLNTKKTILRGMTLIEVIIAMVIIILVTIIAYVGVNTSANLLQKGTELRDADGAAVSQIEAGRSAYMKEGACVTEIIPYDVRIIDAEKASVITSYTEKKTVGVVTVSPEMAGYNMYMPYITTAPASGS